MPWLQTGTSRHFHWLVRTLADMDATVAHTWAGPPSGAVPRSSPRAGAVHLDVGTALSPSPSHRATLPPTPAARRNASVLLAHFPRFQTACLVGARCTCSAVHNQSPWEACPACALSPPNRGIAAQGRPSCHLSSPISCTPAAPANMFQNAFLSVVGLLPPVSIIPSGSARGLASRSIPEWPLLLLLLSWVCSRTKKATQWVALAIFGSYQGPGLSRAGRRGNLWALAPKKRNHPGGWPLISGLANC